MCGTANWYGGTILDDIVPGHTGKGADFRLAEMKYADYPGIYHMIDIDPLDWEHLPDVPPGRDSVNVDAATEEWLDKAGYIIGRLQRVIFYAEGIKETNWSVTRPVVGIDGVERRWVYLHYFKEGQPSINWLDPSFAGMRLVIGDALHSLTDLGSGGLRLDANGFLGAEKTSGEDAVGWSEGASAVAGCQPVHWQHGAQARRLHLPGTQSDDRRHQGDQRHRRRPVLRLRQPARLPPCSGDGRHRIPAPHTAYRHRAGCGSGVAGARAAEPRRTDLRARALVERPQGRHLHLQGPRDHRRSARRAGPRRPHRSVDRPGGTVQPRLYDERNRLHHSDCDRRDAGVHRSRRHRRRHRPHSPCASAAGDVQCAAAGCVRAVRVGPVRHAHLAGGRRRRPAARRGTPAGSTVPRTT